jgi:polyhydroxybutyrate depolymerase
MIRPGRRRSSYALAALAALAVALAATYFGCFHFQRPALPSLSAALQRDTLRVGDRDRTYAYYVPRALPPDAPLLFALHGSFGTGEQIRELTGYLFDQLADQHGFIVVYPDGYEQHWNDCRRVASYSARTLHIDDMGFIRALIERFRASHHVDPARVFAMGHSNGAQMAYRLALEMPDRIRAVAAACAGLPTPDNNDCQWSGKPVSALVMNGTVDPLNPYGGGRSTIYGFGDRGTVRSSPASAQYFAEIGHASGTPSVERISGRDDAIWVERSTWGSPEGAEVVLDTIHGGGHTIPQGVVRYPRMFGPTHADFDGPAEMWSFFARQRPRKPE